MSEMSDARIQATRAKDDIFQELRNATGVKYQKLSQDYITAVEAESSAQVREIAQVLNPKTTNAENTLAAATQTLREELDEFEQQTRAITALTGAIDAILGAILLFSVG